MYNKRNILETIENALALKGFKILDGDGDSIIVRPISAMEDQPDYEIKVNELY